MATLATRLVADHAAADDHLAFLFAGGGSHLGLHGACVSNDGAHSSYVNYRTFEQRLAYARENVHTQEASLKLVQTKNREGAVGVTERDVQQSRQVLEQAEASIVAFLQSQDRAQFAAESADTAQKALEVTNKQYREGAGDYTPVFIFQGTMAQQQDQFAVAQGDVALNLIRLYRALGGGWEMRLQRDAGRQPRQVTVEPSPLPPEEVPPPTKPAPRT